MIRNKEINIVLIICVLVFVSHTCLHAEELIKRTILIMPVYNQNSNSETHLSGNIRDALRAKLDQTRMFNIIPFPEIDSAIEELGWDESDFVNEDKSILLAKELQADVALQSEYSVESGNIFILAQAVDIIAGQPTVSSYLTGTVGFEIFTYINKIADDMAGKMSSKFARINRGMLDQLIREQSVVIEESDDTVIERLLQQTDKYRKFMIKRKGEERALAIPFGKNVVICVSDKYEEYNLRVDGQVVTARKGIKIVTFDNNPGAARLIEVLAGDRVVKSVKYTQRKNYQIDVIRLRFVQ
jgi:hypothetical protein